MSIYLNGKYCFFWEMSRLLRKRHRHQFSKKCKCFYGRNQSFYVRSEEFYGKIKPFMGNVDSFMGNVNVFSATLAIALFRPHLIYIYTIIPDGSFLNLIIYYFNSHLHLSLKKVKYNL